MQTPAMALIAERVSVGGMSRAASRRGREAVPLDIPPTEE
jgi:hypothetical protein